MKKIILLFIGATIMASCGKSKSEQMLYDYQQKNVKKLNLDLADLDFEINSIKKVKSIKVKDSLKEFKKELAQYWKNNPKQSLIDTISFNYMENVLNKAIAQQDTLKEAYQKAVLTAIKIDDYSYEMKSKRKRDKAIDDKSSYKQTLSKVKALEDRYDRFSESPDSILTTKYRANYSFKNPMLNNTKQTFDKTLYTNAAQDKFVKSEDITKD